MNTNKIAIKKGKAWVKALRSGKYKQTSGTLCNDTTYSFCCLGVYCHTLEDFSIEDLDCYDVPSDVGVYITDSDKVEILENVFASLNDKKTWYGDSMGFSRKPQRYTFEEIADFLEENFELL